MLLALAVADYLTGYDINLSLFYVMPVAFAAWFGGKYPGIFMSALSVIAATIADFLAGKRYVNYLVEAWNLLTYVGFYIIVSLLISRVFQQLQVALSEVKQLSGLLPICSSCKKIRDYEGYWNQIESYISAHSEATFTHGICPDCAKKLYPEYYREIFVEKAAEEKKGRANNSLPV
jgi:K+-sensing histidine kinase KdpD